MESSRDCGLRVNRLFFRCAAATSNTTPDGVVNGLRTFEVGLHQLGVLALRNLLRALGGAPAEITRGRLPENFVRGGVSGVDLPNLTTSKLYAVLTVVV